MPTHPPNPAYPIPTERMRPVDWFACFAMLSLSVSNPEPVQAVMNFTDEAWKIARAMDIKRLKRLVDNLHESAEHPDAHRT